MSAQQSQRASVGVLGGSGSQLADQDVAGFSFDDRDEAVVIPFADDGIDLPVTDFRAQVSGERSLADVTFAGEAAATVVGAVALAAFFPGPSQVGVERTAEDPIAPDMPIDSLVADGELSVQSQPTADLLGAEALAQQRFHALEVAAGEALIASRAGAPTSGALDGLARPIVAVPPSAIAFEFTRNAAAVAAEVTRDLRLVEALLSQSGENIPLLGGDLAIRH